MSFIKDTKVRNAFYIGFLCSVAYLAVYVARNVLGSVTPQMVEGGDYTNEFIGSLSSVYFIAYALGQLINGILGDKIKARNMISFGLLFAGVCSFIFPMLKSDAGTAAAYAAMGFFLSMIYAPMTKVVAENTEPIYAVRCSLGYTLASFLGSPMAGLLAAVFVWQSVFVISSAFLCIMGAVCFACFLLLEKRGIVKYNQFVRKRAEKKDGALKELMKRHFAAYTVLAMVTGVIRTAVIFWLPTYLADHLGFSPKTAASIYSFCTLIICFSAFFSVFVYERFKRKTEKTMLLMFVIATALFIGAYFVDMKVINIAFMMLAIFFNNSATSVLWSVYCPSLADTGVVSSATGFLDFASYMAAAISSKVFADSVSSIGWGNLILIWSALMAIGTAVSFVIFRKAAKK